MPISTRALLQTAAKLSIINDFSEIENELQKRQFFLPTY